MNSGQDLNFTKMHGAGNDFVIIEALSVPFSARAELIRQMADRRLGIGCDQFLIIEPPTDPDIDFKCSFYNADGSVTGQCGNGLRCVGHYLISRGLCARLPFLVQVGSRALKVTQNANAMIEVSLGQPDFEPAHLPMVGLGKQADSYQLTLAEKILKFSAVSLGNPHIVLPVDDVEKAPVEELGEMICSDSHFPEGVNVGFMELQSRSEVKLRVFERGVGETPACGSGACAAVVCGQKLHLLDSEVQVKLPGGRLSVKLPDVDGEVFLSGPTNEVFSGIIKLEQRC